MITKQTAKAEVKAAMANLAAVQDEMSAVRAAMGISPLETVWPCPPELRARLYAARDRVEAADKALFYAFREEIHRAYVNAQ